MFDELKIIKGNSQWKSSINPIISGDSLFKSSSFCRFDNWERSISIFSSSADGFSSSLVFFAAWRCKHWILLLWMWKIMRKLPLGERWNPIRNQLLPSLQPFAAGWRGLPSLQVLQFHLLIHQHLFKGEKTCKGKNFEIIKEKMNFKLEKVYRHDLRLCNPHCNSQIFGCPKTFHLPRFLSPLLDHYLIQEAVLLLQNFSLSFSFSVSLVYFHPLQMTRQLPKLLPVKIRWL